MTRVVLPFHHTEKNGMLLVFRLSDAFHRIRECYGVKPSQCWHPAESGIYPAGLFYCWNGAPRRWFYGTEATTCIPGCRLVGNINVN